MTWPTARGNTSHCNKSTITGMIGCDSPVVFITQATHSGVSTIPIKLESVALKTAPATLPRAVAVIATEDETVEGSAHRKNNPSASSNAIRPSNAALSASPINGKRTKVQLWISRCSRQFNAPARNAAKESIKPCRKKIKATPAFVTSSGCIHPPDAPGSGYAHARNVAKIIPSKNQSGLNFIEPPFGLSHPSGESTLSWDCGRPARSGKVINNDQQIQNAKGRPRSRVRFARCSECWRDARGPRT